jgi:hypothetical protein
MISAEQARGLNPETRLKEDLAVLDTIIRKAANEGKPSVRVPHDLVDVDRYEIVFKCEVLVHHLVDLGYIIQARLEDRQFVDVWFEISWASPTNQTETPND